MRWYGVEQSNSGTPMSTGCVAMGELQIGARLKEFEDSGIDQVIFLSQAGRIPHEMLSSSIELFGSEALPEVKERDLKRTEEKAAFKQRIIEKAMARKRARRRC
jgi:hypothetical protein